MHPYSSNFLSPDKANELSQNHSRQPSTLTNQINHESKNHHLYTISQLTQLSCKPSDSRTKSFKRYLKIEDHKSLEFPNNISNNVVKFLKQQKNATIYKKKVPNNGKSLVQRHSDSIKYLYSILQDNQRASSTTDQTESQPELNRQEQYQNDNNLSVIPPNQVLVLPEVLTREKIQDRFQWQNIQRQQQKSFQQGNKQQKESLNYYRSKPIIEGQNEDIHYLKTLYSPKISDTEFNQTQELKTFRENITEPNQDEYYNVYKNFDKAQQYKEAYKLEDNIYVKMSAKSLLPRKLALIGQKNTSSINSYKLGGFLNQFTEGISSSTFKDLKLLNVTDSNITDQGIDQLIQKLPWSIVDLRLSKNKVTKYGVINIIQYMNSGTSNLKGLYLDSNTIGDEGFQQIVEGLELNKKLTKLDISQNGITDQPMAIFSRYIRKFSILQEIYLHYNRLTAIGGKLLFKGIKRNIQLRVLDLSFNSLGQNKNGKSCIKELGKAINKTQSELHHLDLSYNQFKQEETVKFSEILLLNRQLYGLHFEGNLPGVHIDYKGFLIIPEKIEPQKLCELNHKRIQSTYPFRKNSESDTCWICSGWNEIKFQYITGQSGKMSQEPIYLHLSFQNYKPQLMQKEQSTNKFYIYEMCPPNSVIRYFFSNPTLNVYTYAKNQKSQQTPKNDLIGSQQVTLSYGTTQLYNNIFLKREIKIEKIKVINFLQTGNMVKIIDSEKHYLLSILSHPREEERYFDLSKVLEQKKQQLWWSVEVSIFKDFQATTQVSYEECFEMDQKLSTINHFTKSDADLKRINQMLCALYPHIVETYKYYAACSLNYQCPCVSLNSFNDFLKRTTVLEKKLIKNIDLELHFLSANSKEGNENQILSKDKTIQRYQFADMLLRLAHDQYIKSKQCTFLSEAFQKFLINDSVQSVFEEFENPQEWRDERYWNQPCELVIKFKQPVIQLLFKYAILFSKKNFQRVQWVSASDWLEFLTQSELFVEGFDEKEAYYIYLSSLQLQPEENSSNKQSQMNKLEFIEGLARIAERLSPASPYSPKRQTASMQERKKQALFIKLEALLFILYHKLKGFIRKSFQQNFLQFPEIPNKKLIYSAWEVYQQSGQSDNYCNSSSDSDSSVDSIELSPDQKRTILSSPEKLPQFIQELITQDDNLSPKKLTLQPRISQVRMSNSYKKLSLVAVGQLTIRKLSSITKSKYTLPFSTATLKNQNQAMDQGDKETDIMLPQIKNFGLITSNINMTTPIKEEQQLWDIKE